MSEFEKVAVLLTVMQQLRAVMVAETEAVRSMQLDRLTRVQEEKRLLAENYERELRALRSQPELIGSLPLETRRALEDAMREMQLAVRQNLDMLGAAKTVVERLLRRVAEGLRVLPADRATPAGLGRVIAVAFDRQI